MSCKDSDQVYVLYSQFSKERDGSVCSTDHTFILTFFKDVGIMWKSGYCHDCHHFHDDTC